jgi:hypothetical protein
MQNFRYRLTLGPSTCRQIRVDRAVVHHLVSRREGRGLIISTFENAREMVFAEDFQACQARANDA